MTDNNDKTEWDFNKLEINEPKVNLDVTPKKNPVKAPAKRALTLGEAPPLKTKTRSELASDMNNAKELDDSDIFKLASAPRRAIAFLLDLGFLYGLFQFVLLATPVVRSLIQHFFDIYNLQFLVSETLVMNGLYFATGYLTLFFMVIIPVSFFNHSFGKRLLKLKVRGKAKYTISLGEAIKRELVLKPLSVLIIAGFVTPFFSKSKSSIHDMMCDTLVIED